MKKWIFAMALCGAFGCSQQQQPGQPLGFAPGPPPAAPAPSAAEEEAAPSDAPMEAEPQTEGRGSLKDEESRAGGAEAPAEKAVEDNMQDEADLARPAKRAKAASTQPKASKGASDTAAICDSACKKACANAADKNVCAQAYAAGCFSGTAPATFDCGTSGEKRKIKDDGVEAHGLPIGIP